jgi:3,4-dihydroxy 2-butanone 4-phosphate synthase/GTP cyclohydrolase II
MIAYGTDVDQESHVALVRGDVACSDKPVLVRMHTHCLAGDVFHALSCECASNIRSSLRRIVNEGVGAVIYLHQNSLGFSHEKIDGADTPEFHKDEKGSGSLRKVIGVLNTKSGSGLKSCLISISAAPG